MHATSLIRSMAENLTPDFTSPTLDQLRESSFPSFVWDVTRGRISWGNRAALVFFDETSLLDLIERDFAPTDPTVCELADIATRFNAEPMVETRLAFDGALARQAVACHCYPAALDDGRAGLTVTIVPTSRTTPRTRFEEIAEAAPAPLLLVSPEGKILYRNEDARRTLPQCAPDAPFENLFENTRRMGPLLELALSDNSASRTVSLRTKAGFRMHRLTVRKIQDPQLDTPALVVLLRDIADRRAREAEQTNAVTTQASLLAQVSDFQWQLDHADRLTGLSLEFEALSGLVSNTLIGLTFSEMARVMNTNLPPALTQLLSERKSFHDLPFQLATPDGVKPYLLSGVPTPAHGMTPRGWLGIGRAALEPVETIIEKEVVREIVVPDFSKQEELNRDLVAAQDELKLKSNLLSTVAHELKTPLNAILGFSEIMQTERFGELGDERYVKYAGHINRSGEYLLDLVRDFLDLNKMEAGRFTPAFERIDLPAVLNECIDLLTLEAERNGISLDLELPNTLPALVADPRSVQQIMLNLLSNAVKFTPDGGRVTLLAKGTDDGGLAIEVQDTGYGMSPEDITLALQPFMQAGKRAINGSGITTPQDMKASQIADKNAKGSGLGLPIAKALCEANHADFSLISEPNVGTCVRITFPVTQVLID